MGVDGVCKSPSMAVIMQMLVPRSRTYTMTAGLERKCKQSVENELNRDYMQSRLSISNNAVIINNKHFMAHEAQAYETTTMTSSRESKTKIK